MQRFQSISWPHDIVEEMYTDSHGKMHKTAHYTVSESKIPFTYEDWCQENGFKPMETPENIYGYCSCRLTRPFCRKMVEEAATRLELDPGYVKMYEKMASFYILRLLAGIPRKEAWSTWKNIPKTNDLLQDEVFCLCVMALHPILYGKLHPYCRNNRRVALEAIAGWDLPKFSVLQYCHPYAMRQFNEMKIHPISLACQLQYHTDGATPYWLFDDYSVISRVIGKPGKRRWHELEFSGPTAVKKILDERTSHGSSNTSLEQFIKKNKYIN